MIVWLSWTGARAFNPRFEQDWTYILRSTNWVECISFVQANWSSSNSCLTNWIEYLTVVWSMNWICWILLTGERMDCYCCLSKMNGKSSLLYRKSSSFIYLLILISWSIEVHLRIEIFVCHEGFFFWSRHLRSSLSLRSDLIRIAYSSSNSLISRQSRISVDLKEIISIELL